MSKLPKKEQQSLKGKSVLVSGGAGFIGSHLVDALIARGLNVTVIDNLSSGRSENINKKAEFIKADILDYKLLKKIVKDKDIIFHIAASATTKETSMGWKDPVYDYKVNALGTLNMLRAILEKNRDVKFLYASSAAVYGEPEYTPIKESHPTNPISPYGISKLTGEKYCYAYFKEYGLYTIVLRIFNTYGPRQPRYVMFDLLKKLWKNHHKLEVLGTGDQVRDYCYISDLVRAFILAIKKAPPGSVFNIGSGEGITIRALVDRLIQIYQPTQDIEVYYTGKSWKGDINVLNCDITKARKILGFKPKVKLEEGLMKLVDWFMTYVQTEKIS